MMTLVERKLRESIWIKVRNHSAEAIDEALSALIEQFGDKYNEVFKSITGDNGSEFANLPKVEAKGISVYFTHPYSSYEKGTNECHNRMLRRFIPKGKSIDDYSADDILFFADKINNLPRKILGYHTPEELFEQEASFPRSSLRSSLEKLAAIYYRLKNCFNLLLQFADYL